MPYRGADAFGLTEREVQILAFQDRYDQAWLTLGGTLNGRRIYRKVFLWVLDGVRDWRLSSLATSLDMPRTTLRKFVEDALVTGWLQNTGRHTYAATSIGLDTFLEIQLEARRIASGLQTGYSPRLLARLGENPLMCVRKEASRISFPKNLSLMDGSDLETK